MEVSGRQDLPETRDSAFHMYWVCQRGGTWPSIYNTRLRGREGLVLEVRPSCQVELTSLRRGIWQRRTWRRWGRFQELTIKASSSESSSIVKLCPTTSLAYDMYFGDAVGNLEACFLAGLSVIFTDYRDVFWPHFDLLERATMTGYNLAAYMVTMAS
nr:unnamed protein product [Digitaria exilis]